MATGLLRLADIFCYNSRQREERRVRMMMTLATLFAATVTHWAVPAMSDEMRTPDRVPQDGEEGGIVRIVAAKNEYEPGSFVLRAGDDLGKVSLGLSELKTEDGNVFPAEDLDLKVVKVWYQNLNGWFSYFGDTGGFKLIPELLLNDEDLIRVDTNKTANYARLVGTDGKVTEKWINPPAAMDKRPSSVSYRSFDTFFPMRPDFRDARTLQPVRLGKGESKQFFLTAHTRPETAAGVYRGAISLMSGDQKLDAEIPVEVKVLDFALPKTPKCYADPSMDFWVCFYSYISFDYLMVYNGGDRELAKKQLESVLRNQVEHGQNMHWFRTGLASGASMLSTPERREEFLFTLGAMRKAGMITDPIVGWVAGGGLNPKGDEATIADARACAAELDQLVGHHNLYIGYGDEPSAPNLTNAHRRVEKLWQEAGFKFILASAPHAFRKNGHLLDWHNASNEPGDGTMPGLWNTVGAGKRCAWYAAQHVGAEDPVFNRRQNGLVAWLNGSTALCNYAHHFGPYNDDSTTYKPMVYAYGISTGVLDTLQWEGFREGIDDIRYASLMISLAREAEKNGDLAVRRLGMKAMQYLALLDPERDDLAAARLEMANYISQLKEALR